MYTPSIPVAHGRGSEAVAELSILEHPVQEKTAEDGPISRPAEQDAVAVTAKPARLLSLDLFRGLTIALMLLVNNIALDTATPPQLMHAGWNQMLHLADLVFPWFLFCVGVAIPFAVASFHRKKLPSWRYDLKVLGRTAALLLLGILIESSIQRHITLSLGVLQIIALAYLVAAMVYELPLFRRMLITGIMLVAYWVALKFIAIPGVGVGIHGETQNLIWFVNVNFFNSMKIGPIGFSLWGIPSILPTAALVLIGTAIGDLLRKREMRVVWKSLFLFAASAVLTVAGYLWHYNILFSKALWTPSYILFCAGTGTFALLLFYLLIDVCPWKAWGYPLLVLGSNAILVYVAPILVKVMILEGWHAAPGVTLEQRALSVLATHYGPIHGGWIYTIVYILVWWVILWQLYRKKVFLRV